MKKLLFGLTLLCLLGGCASKSDMDMRVVAKAGDLEFTMYDMECYLTRFNYKDPDDEWYKKQDFLNQHLDKMLVVNEGLKYGLYDSVDVDSAQVARILYEIVYKREVTDKRNITDKGVREFWEKYGGEVQFSQILVESRDLADSLSRLLKAEPDRFVEMVALFSEDEVTRKRDGDLGWMRITDMPDELHDTAFSLEIGEISSPVKSPFGYHVIKIFGRRNNTEEDFELEKGDYRFLYSAQVRDKLQNEYGEFLKKELNFEFNEDSWRMLVDKAIELKSAGFDPSTPLSQCISIENLTEDEAQMVMASIDRYDYTVELFLSDVKKFFRREGLQFELPDLAIKTIDMFMIPRMMYIYGEVSGLKDSPEFKRQYKDTRLGSVFKKMERDYLLDTITVTDEEIREYYEDREYSFIEKEQIKIAEISLTTEAEAKDILRQLKNGAPFGTLVKKTIRVGFDKTNGNLGYCSETRYRPIYEAAEGLKVGEYGGPVKFTDNWSVFKVTDIIPEHLKPFEDVAGQIRSQILGSKKYYVYHGWLDEQKKHVDHFLDSALVKANLETGTLEDEI